MDFCSETQKPGQMALDNNPKREEEDDEDIEEYEWNEEDISGLIHYLSRGILMEKYNVKKDFFIEIIYDYYQGVQNLL